MVTSMSTTSGVQLGGHSERLLTIGGLAHDFEAVVLEGAAQSFAQHAVVVGKQ